jgi:hypothetical protein
MAKIRFENGTVVNFDGTPTPADVEEVALKLGITTQKSPEVPSAQKPLIDRIVESPLSKGIQSFFPGAKLGEAVGTSIAATGQALKGDFKGAKNIIQSQVPVKQVAGDVIGALALPASMTIGGGTGATAISRLASAGAKYGASGAITSLGKSMAEGKDNSQIAKETLTGGAIGFGLGAGVQGVSELAPLVKSGVNKLLAQTSDTPEEAFKIINSRPVASAQIGKATPEGALKNTQEAVRGLRTTLTKEWDDGVGKIADEYTGVRVGLPSKMTSTLDKVDELVGGIENMPQNKASISAQELIKLQTEINGIARKPAFLLSPQGASVRKLADELKSLGVNTFGGDAGSYATLYKNYSAKKGVLDAADDIVRAYKTGKPITQVTAQNRLQKIFDENKVPYLSAIRELENLTGKDVLSQIAASKFQGILPKTPSVGGDIWTKTLKILTLPLTSPRGAAWLSQAMNAGKSPTLRAGVNVAIPAISSSVAVPQESLPPEESISSTNTTTFSPEVQRILNMQQ